MGTTPVAAYLPDTGPRHATRARLPIIISAFIAALTVLFTASGAGVAHTIAAINHGGAPTDDVAHAGQFGLFGTADSLGQGMDDYSPWEGSFTSVPIPSKPGRTWTLQEVTGNSLQFINYQGEGEGDTFTATTNPDRHRDVHYNGLDGDKVKKLRSSGTIFLGGWAAMGADLASGLSSIVYSVAHLTATTAFSPSFVCSDPKDKACVINLVSIVGGTGDGVRNGGLIGSLRDSLFFPFTGIVGFSVMILALFRWKMKKIGTRGIMWRLAWTILILLFISAFLFAPAMVASAPVTAAQTIGGCILGTISGGGCSGDGPQTQKHISGGSTSKSEVVCRSSVEGASAKDEMALAVNGMLCSVWRTFQLDAYSRGSFGRSFAKMDVEDEKIKQAIEKAGLSKDDFCVPLRSSGSAQDYFGKTLELDGSTDHKTCNIVAYQLFLRSDAESTTDKRTLNPVDQRWYKIVAVTVNDDQLWTNWTYSIGSSMNRAFSVTTSLMALIPAAILLTVVSLFALVYEFLSTIMMVLFPVFGLLALDPDRGRRLFLGWLGSAMSYISKYGVSALFIVLAIAIFSALLDTVENPALANLLVILATFALFMYRGEMLEKLGIVNLGGDAMRNRVAEFGKKVQEREGHRMRALLGGAAAGVMNSDPAAARRTGDNVFKNASRMGGALFKGAARGAKYGLHEDGKRNGSDFMKKVYRASDRMASDNRRDLDRQASMAQNNANNLDREIAAQERTQENTGRELSKLREGYDKATSVASEAAPTVSSVREHEERIRLLMEPVVADYLAAKNEQRDVAYARGLAHYQGDKAAAAALDTRHQELTGTIQKLEGKHGADTLRAREAQYRSDVDTAVAMDGVYTGENGANAMLMDAYRADVSAAKAHHEYTGAAAKYNDRAAQLEELRPQAAGERARAEALDEARATVSHSRGVKQEALKSMMEAADTRASEAAEESFTPERRVDDLMYQQSPLADVVPAVAYGKEAAAASADVSDGPDETGGDPTPGGPDTPDNDGGPTSGGDAYPTAPTPSDSGGIRLTEDTGEGTVANPRLQQPVLPIPLPTNHDRVAKQLRAHRRNSEANNNNAAPVRDTRPQPAPKSESKQGPVKPVPTPKQDPVKPTQQQYPTAPQQQQRQVDRTKVEQPKPAPAPQPGPQKPPQQQPAPRPAPEPVQAEPRVVEQPVKPTPQPKPKETMKAAPPAPQPQQQQPRPAPKPESQPKPAETVRPAPTPPRQEDPAPAPHEPGGIFTHTPEQDAGIKSTLQRMRNRPSQAGQGNRVMNPEQYPHEPRF